jgi:hypothetical protein
MKKYRILLVITFGLILLGFVPLVQAKTTILPIERYWEDQWGWYENNPHLGGYWDPDSNLIVRPHTIGFTFTDGWEFAPFWDCDYGGDIKVRELNGKDGYDLMVTITRLCNDAPFILIDYNNFPFPLFLGTMDYKSVFKFKIDLELYPFQDEDGWYLPIWWAPLFGWNTFDPRDDGMEAVYSHFLAMGEGEFLGSWNGWTEGDEANVKVHQIAHVRFLYGEEGWEEHPNYYPPSEEYVYGELWPVEYISVF